MQTPRISIAAVAVALPTIRGGRVKAIAVPSQARVPVLPTVPLASDTVPGMVGDVWIGMYAPKGTPREAVHQMSEAITRVLSAPEMESVAETQGGILMKGGPDEVARITRAEIERWAPIVRASGMKVD